MSYETKDWKGNIIKEGDEICLIRTKYIDYFGKASMCIPQEDGSFKEIVVKEKPNPTKDVWEVGEYYKVFLKEGRLCIMVKYDDWEVTQGIEGMMYFEPSEIVLGIKGFSDTKE